MRLKTDFVPCFIFPETPVISNVSPLDYGTKGMQSKVSHFTLAICKMFIEKRWKVTGDSKQGRLVFFNVKNRTVKGKKYKYKVIATFYLTIQSLQFAIDFFYQTKVQEKGLNCEIKKVAITFWFFI